MSIDLNMILGLLPPILLGICYSAWGLITLRQGKFVVRFRGIEEPVTFLTGRWAIIVGISFLLGGGLFFIGWLQISILASVGCFLPPVVVLSCLIMDGMIKLGKYLGEYPEKPKRKEKPKNDQKPKHGE